MRRRCFNRPFWIWNQEEHRKVASSEIGANCCFNHIIGLPRQSGTGKQLGMFDYEDQIYQALTRHKRVWVKKATGLGITEFILRFMVWLALSTLRSLEQTRQIQNYCVVTGPNINIAIGLITRMKRLFVSNGIYFEDKDTVLDLGSVKIEAFPSHHLDSMRGLTNVKFIFLDEADFFPKSQQQDARNVSERYIGKSDAYIAMVSTPNQPDGLFANIEAETRQQSLYYKIQLDFRAGLGKIYTEQDIQQARRSPSFEREYNLQYLGSIGNVFSQDDITEAISNYEITQYLDDLKQFPYIQGVMGLDPGWGVSKFGIVVTHFVDGLVKVAYVNQHSRGDHAEMISLVWDLIQIYNVTKVLVDAAAPSFIRALKLQWGERADYENVDKKQREYMKVEPVAFGMEHKALLYHAKFMLENKYVQIHPTQDKLITSLRSAWARDGVLDKDMTSYDDILDAFRLALRPYKEQSLQL